MTSSYHGITIPAGAKISLLNGSADRDERHFPDPDASTCGATSTGSSRSGTARTSASAPRWRGSKTRVALAETLKRYPTWEIDESRLEFVHTATVRGYTTVPMRVR